MSNAVCIRHHQCWWFFICSCCFEFCCFVLPTSFRACTHIHLFYIIYDICIRFITIGSIFIEKCWLGKFFWRWALSCFKLFSITLCLVVFHGDAFFPCHLAFFVHFLFRCVHSMRVGALSCICLCIYFVQMFSCRLPNNKCVFFPMSLSYLLLLLLLPP